MSDGMSCSDRYFNKVLSRVNFDIGAKMANFLATGNLVSPSGLDLQQASGFTIVAEKLNWHRYISHFRCIHRGAFFAELKTTTVRKLLPESWGKIFRFILNFEDLIMYEQASSALYIRLTVPPAASSTTCLIPVALLRHLSLLHIFQLFWPRTV